MDTSRAREQLGWEPKVTSLQALDDLLTGCKTPRAARRRPWSQKPAGRYEPGGSPAASASGSEIARSVPLVSGMVFGFRVEGRGIEGPWRD
jgi:hypothetical protein